MSIYRWAKLDDQSGPDRSIELTGLSSGDGAPEVRPLVPRARPRKPALWTVATAALVLGIAALLLTVSATRLATPRLLKSVQVTNDGLLKGGLMFGGRTLFFETRDGERWTFMKAPTGGGTASSVTSYSPGSFGPLDISSDESELLVWKNDSLTSPFKQVRLDDDQIFNDWARVQAGMQTS